MIRRALAALVAAAAAVLVAGCEIRTEVGIRVEDDGSGVVTVAVGLDGDAMDEVPGLEHELRLDDLVATGWDIRGPALEADGFTWIRASKPFATPEEAGAVLAEVTGDGGPFQGFRVERDRSFARTRWRFEGTVDFTGGLERFGDQALAEALEGEPLGEDVAAIEARLNRPIDEVFRFRVAVRLPGDLRSSNAPSEASNGAVWEPRISEDGAIALRAEAEKVRTGTIALTAVAVLAAVAAVTVALARRRPASRSAGR